MCVAFVPWDKLGIKDAVRRTIPDFVPFFSERFQCFRVEDGRTSFAEIAQTPLGEGGCRRIGLFAHPSANGRGFAVNPVDVDRVLRPRWWREPGQDPPFELLYAHVCNGSSVLHDRIWLPVFPAWISYDRAIGIFVDTAAGRKRWSSCLESILDAVADAKQVTLARDAVVKIYEHHLSEALKAVDDCPSDFINSALLEDALQALSCSTPDP